MIIYAKQYSNCEGDQDEFEFESYVTGKSFPTLSILQQSSTSLRFLVYFVVSFSLSPTPCHDIWPGAIPSSHTMWLPKKNENAHVNTRPTPSTPPTPPSAQTGKTPYSKKSLSNIPLPHLHPIPHRRPKSIPADNSPCTLSVYHSHNP